MCLLFISSCQSGGGDFAAVRNLGSLGKTIVCFGDSLTEGVGAGGGKSYPTLLGEALQMDVINAGRRGDTAAAGLTRLDRDVLAKDPRLVVLLFGGNDFLRRVPIDKTQKDLEQMIRRIQDQGAMVALVGLKLGLLGDEYSPLFKKVASDSGALLIPNVLKGILTDPRLKSDTIHPNGAGYAIMAERILKRVKPLLAAAERRRG